jgi:predicted DNA-binding transcriptional regulator AlpA
MAPRPIEKLMRRKELLNNIPISKSTLYNRYNDGTFPPEVKITNKGIALWRYDLILEVLTQTIRRT